jgi:lysophospholipase L1-like esterase
MNLRLTLAVVLLVSIFPALASSQDPAPKQLLQQAKTVLFLGDSITAAGKYVADFDAWLVAQRLADKPTVINCGLASETVSGLSEEGHASGKFPRPDLAERLDRVLEVTKPDLVIACYGMNCGIYLPLDDQRLQKYQHGIEQLKSKVEKAGARLILVTPPFYDDKSQPKEFSYNDVLGKYGEWLLGQRRAGWNVIDLHGPMTHEVAKRREKNPDFLFQRDGVHPNDEGHWFMAQQLIRAFGDSAAAECATPEEMLAAKQIPKEVMPLVQKRMSVLRDAYVAAAGHKRPGVAKGLPIPEALAQAAKLTQQIAALMPEQEASQSGDRMLEVNYAASSVPEELQMAVTYRLWIPAGAKTIRGIIVHQHGCGVGACKGGETAADDLHWQALARKWDCALLGPSYHQAEEQNCRLWCDPRNGSDKTFLRSLGDFAQQSSHPEIATAPWCLWGHSGGGFWESIMQTLHPERIVAIWFRSGTAYATWEKDEIPRPELPAAMYQIPMMCNPGAKENGDARFKGAWDGTLAMFKAYRAKGAPIGFAPDPLTAHQCGDSRYLAIPFFDACLAERLPAKGSSEAKLRPVDQKAAWLATVLSDTAVPAAEYKVNADEAVWLPNAAVAKAWSEYVKTGAVSDTTPPPAPSHVAVRSAGDGAVAITWQAVADFESGIQAFIIERDGKPIGQVPEKPLGRFGRPLFQTMSYHDTPEAPLPAMKFVDLSPPSDSSAKYRVVSVNSVGLKSAPSIPASVTVK